MAFLFVDHKLKQWAVWDPGIFFGQAYLSACLPAWWPQVTAAGLVTFIEATPVLQQLDVLMPEAGPAGAAVNFDTCFALAAQCPSLKVIQRLDNMIYTYP